MEKALRVATRHDSQKVVINKWIRTSKIVNNETIDTLFNLLLTHPTHKGIKIDLQNQIYARGVVPINGEKVLVKRGDLSNITIRDSDKINGTLSYLCMVYCS